jgi:hypothetical protein
MRQKSEVRSQKSEVRIKPICRVLYAVCGILFLASCGITVKEYKLRSLNWVSIRVHVINNTYEAGAAYAFKNAIEEQIVKKGGSIDEKAPEYDITVTLREILGRPVSFTRADVANAYSLDIKGSYKILSKKGEDAKTLIADNFAQTYSYSIAGIEQAEINRQLIIEQAAREIAGTITDRVAMTLPAMP